MNTVVLQRIKHTLLVVGVLLLITTVLLFVATLMGLVRLPEQLIAGESTEHSVARVAILGCLMAAVGTLD